MKKQNKTTNAQGAEGKCPTGKTGKYPKGKTWMTPEQWENAKEISDSFKEPEKKEFRMSGDTLKIQNSRTSLHQFPSFARKEMDEQGNASLSNCTYKIHKCGCDIIGNGTLQNPLEIKFCNKHK